MALMNFLGRDALPTGEIIDHNDKIFRDVEGDGTLCKRCLTKAEFGDTFDERLELRAVVSLDVINDRRGPTASTTAHKAL